MNDSELFVKILGNDGIERTALNQPDRQRLRERLKSVSDVEIRNLFAVSKNLLQKYYLYPGDVPITEKGKKAVRAILSDSNGTDGSTVAAQQFSNQTVSEMVALLKRNGVKEVILRF